jgi:hypothetical protein
VAKRRATKSARTTKPTLDDPPPLSLSKRSVELLSELATQERRDRSEILNDALEAYASPKDTSTPALKTKRKRR